MAHFGVGDKARIRARIPQRPRSVRTWSLDARVFPKVLARYVPAGIRVRTPESPRLVCTWSYTLTRITKSRRSVPARWCVFARVFPKNPCSLRTWSYARVFPKVLSRYLDSVRIRAHIPESSVYELGRSVEI